MCISTAGGLYDITSEVLNNNQVVEVDKSAPQTWCERPAAERTRQFTYVMQVCRGELFLSAARA
jgi:hypothetical protein